MQSFRYRMYEMEKAAKNGFARMLLSRMVVLSVGDLVTVLLCMIVISSKNYASAGMVLLWYLAPLFLIGSFCTGWMQKIEAKFDMEDQTLRCIQICEGACVGLFDFAVSFIHQAAICVWKYGMVDRHSRDCGRSYAVSGKEGYHHTILKIEMNHRSFCKERNKI